MASSKVLKIKDYILLQLIFILYSLMLFVAKFASEQNLLSIKFVLLYGGMLFIMGIYAVCWQQFIKKVNLVVAYSSRGMIVFYSFIWAVAFLNESITVFNVMGGLIIIIGIVLVVSND